MDKIEFERVKVHSPGSVDIGARILINGEDFKNVLEALANKTLKGTSEKHYNYQKAQSLYGYLTYNEYFAEHNEAAILTCTCMTDECGGAWCKVKETKTEIIWRDFHHILCDKWEIGEFRFDKKQYRQEIEKLKGFTV